MPQLPNAEGNTLKFILPSTKDSPEADQAYVMLQVGKILASDMINLGDLSNDLGTSFGLLANRIKEWNYTSADGSPIPITVDNIGGMELDDITYLFEQLTISAGNDTALTTDQKKSS